MSRMSIRRMQKQHNHRLDAVRRLAPFATCSDKELSIIDSLGAAIEVRTGVDLATQGATGRECFLVEKGSVQISLGAAVHIVGAGEWVGEMALLNDVPRNATATTLCETTVWVFDPAEFQIILDRVPRVAQQVREVALSRRAALDGIAS